jgi:hypothetical protein
MALAIEFIMLVMIVLVVGFIVWKFALSKIPAVRIALKLSNIKEIDTLSNDASKIDVTKVKQHKSLLNDFEKEKL